MYDLLRSRHAVRHTQDCPSMRTLVRASGEARRAHPILPYMWVILCLVGYKLVGERLAAFARARKRSDVTRGHMWANPILVVEVIISTEI